MTACRTTGLTLKQQERWPFLYSHLSSDIEIPSLTDVDEQFIIEMDKEISKILKHIGDGKAKSRESLTRHLTGLLQRRFQRNAKVQAFGSSVTGLSLGTGDLDLCLSFKKEQPKKVLRKVAGLLREEGMMDIQQIPKAKIPIVKFTDSRSRLDVDISIENRLAIYNSKMLKSYAQDKRVREFILMIKYWASRRGINTAFEGTLSSYAWTLISIQHLQMTNPPVAPNRQKGNKKNLFEMNGISYDISHDSSPFESENQQTLASLLIAFFDRFATRWDWNEMVVSIRNGSPLNTEKKKWMHTGPLPLEVVTGQSNNRMEHIMPIEDPFDHEHDLSRVVKPEGAMTIQEEFMRALHLLSEGTSWKQICTPVMEIDEEPEDFFHDLRTQNTDTLRTTLEEMKAEVTGVEEHIQSLVTERQNSKELLDLLRGTLQKTRNVKSNRQSILAELRPLSMKVQELRQTRDGINDRIAIPTKRIRQEMVRMFDSLTAEVDIFNTQNLGKERGDFSYFFELQAMYKASIESNEAHQEFIRLRREQNKEYKALKKTNSEEEDVLNRLIEKNPELKGINLHPKTVKEFQHNANKLQKSINIQYSKKHELKREIGRIEAWIRIAASKGNQRQRNDSKPRVHRRQAPAVNINEVRERASSGGSFSLNELDALLSKGGISGIESTKRSPTPNQSDRRKSGRKKATYRVDPRQGRKRGNKQSRK
jgi:DNA polymerase sigma